MFATVSVTLANTTLARLLEYQQRAGGELSYAIEEAIEDWLSRHTAPDGNTPVGDSAADRSTTNGNPESPAHTPASGYQWKLLFLPEGTWLRTWSYGEHRFARVVGNRIVHEGRVVSPNQFARSFARSMRNAWKDISICLPGEKTFRLANKLRRELEQQEASTQLQPRRGQDNAPQRSDGQHCSGNHGGGNHGGDNHSGDQRDHGKTISGKLNSGKPNSGKPACAQQACAQQACAAGQPTLSAPRDVEQQAGVPPNAGTEMHTDTRLAKQATKQAAKQAEKQAEKQRALQAALEAALPAALSVHHASQEQATRNVTPGTRWDLPERRSLRYRLEDVAFE